MSLEGKVAAVTGAARGMGRGYVEAFLQRKAKVAVIDLTEEAGQATVEEFRGQYGAGNVIFVRGDVSKRDVMEGVFQKILSEFGRLDIMINNAGVGGMSLGADLAIQVNTLGLMHTTELAIEKMRKDKDGNGGVIINIGSIAGMTLGAGSGVYNASKHGAVSYTLCRAMGLPAEYGLRIICLNPTFVATEMTSGFKQMEDEGNTRVKNIIEKMGGWVSMDSVVNACLACVEGDVESGTNILVSGEGVFRVRNELVKTPFP